MKQDKNFDLWNELKQKLHAVERGPYFKEREVWFAAVGHNIGYEENGKNARFERPLVIIKKFNKHIFIGIPLSTVIKEHNQHYVVIHQGNQKRSAIISQIRLFSSKRLLRRMFIVEELEFKKVCEALGKEIIPLDTLNGKTKKTDSIFTESSGPEGICTSSIAKPDTSVNTELRSQVDRELWSRRTIFEQMGSIHIEFQNSLRAYHEQDSLGFAQTLDRAIDLFDATVESCLKDSPHRVREILAAKHEFLRLFYLPHTPEEEESLERYFAFFAHAAGGING